ncbi:uncharacterized protein L969DRAFT_46707 [Mixia osmundae IAM 14324]|uniref:Uncharacterized protein n=1 Tax=Mixia osmundae (strain CBS 9802 / IAM 14324 / JCM 22182 / KY 12970) TaxID=764103 RepID=G7DUG5_MIXOS|nr:uncharacterized protein L969DRAFT_46707 [Mixia osmundae IAM 14324]KEI41098.1 hypothetical protein L969DRAFT_46707 [Mixia osmundae IAM 14324]GAA94225.1 hypothetical protein E5Q_00874 [Mixia osmundae IAM 14324]
MRDEDRQPNLEPGVNRGVNSSASCRVVRSSKRADRQNRTDGFYRSSTETLQRADSFAHSSPSGYDPLQVASWQVFSEPDAVRRDRRQECDTSIQPFMSSSQWNHAPYAPSQASRSYDRTMTTVPSRSRPPSRYDARSSQVPAQTSKPAPMQRATSSVYSRNNLSIGDNRDNQDSTARDSTAALKGSARLPPPLSRVIQAYGSFASAGTSAPNHPIGASLPPAPSSRSALSGGKRHLPDQSRPPVSRAVKAESQSPPPPGPAASLQASAARLSKPQRHTTKVQQSLPAAMSDNDNRPVVRPRIHAAPAATPSSTALPTGYKDSTERPMQDGAVERGEEVQFLETRSRRPTSQKKQRLPLASPSRLQSRASAQSRKYATGLQSPTDSSWTDEPRSFPSQGSFADTSSASSSVPGRPSSSISANAASRRHQPNQPGTSTGLQRQRKRASHASSAVPSPGSDKSLSPTKPKRVRLHQNPLTDEHSDMRGMSEVKIIPELQDWYADMRARSAHQIESARQVCEFEIKTCLAEDRISGTREPGPDEIRDRRMTLNKLKLLERLLGQGLHQSEDAPLASFSASVQSKNTFTPTRGPATPESEIDGPEPDLLPISSPGARPLGDRRHVNGALFARDTTELPTPSLAGRLKRVFCRSDGRSVAVTHCGELLSVPQQPNSEWRSEHVNRLSLGRGKIDRAAYGRLHDNLILTSAAVAIDAPLTQAYIVELDMPKPRALRYKPHAVPEVNKLKTPAITSVIALPSPDSLMFATGGNKDREVYIWTVNSDWSEKKPVSAFAPGAKSSMIAKQAHHRAAVVSLGYSTGQSWLLSCSSQLLLGHDYSRQTITWRCDAYSDLKQIFTSQARPSHTAITVAAFKERQFRMLDLRQCGLNRRAKDAEVAQFGFGPAQKMGSIQYGSFHDHHFAMACPDQCVRLFDMRNTTKAAQEIRLPGVPGTVADAHSAIDVCFGSGGLLSCGGTRRLYYNLLS